MKNTSSVYLAGPIAGSGYDEVNDWRIDAALQLSPIKTLNPMRAKDFLKGEKEDVHNYERTTIIENALGSSKGITSRDRFDVANCDLVLMNLLNAKRVSTGSMIEVGWADAYRKPLVLVIDEGNVHLHPMLLDIAGFIVTNMDEAIHVVKAILL